MFYFLSIVFFSAPPEPTADDIPSTDVAQTGDQTSQIVVQVNEAFLNDSSNGDLLSSYVIVARTGYEGLKLLYFNLWWCSYTFAFTDLTFQIPSLSVVTVMRISRMLTSRGKTRKMHHLRNHIELSTTYHHLLL